ncbi:MAG: DUF6232 family protein [Desulfobulbaceae bacterium]|nr:DUF6232 family protein [Desulfobulbaceae bacterium]
MNEQTLLKTEEVKITSHRAIFRGKTFALNNITSVETHRVPPNNLGPGIVCLIGIVLFFTGIAMLLGGVGEPEKMFQGGSSLFVGILIFVASIYMFRTSTPTYFVRLTTNAGQNKAFGSKDKKPVDEIVIALNKAIALR